MAAEQLPVTIQSILFGYLKVADPWMVTIIGPLAPPFTTSIDDTITIAGLIQYDLDKVDATRLRYHLQYGILDTVYTIDNVTPSARMRPGMNVVIRTIARQEEVDNATQMRRWYHQYPGHTNDMVDRFHRTPYGLVKESGIFRTYFP